MIKSSVFKFVLSKTFSPKRNMCMCVTPKHKTDNKGWRLLHVYYMPRTVRILEMTTHLIFKQSHEVTKADIILEKRKLRYKEVE